MILLENIQYSIGSFTLQELNLQLNDGEYFVMLGKPGSGKTMLLECICGLRPLASGRIVFNGRDVTKLPPNVRNVGYVPQDYALFPHLNVENNISFGLQEQRVSKTDQHAQVEEITTLLDINHLLTRQIKGLSGGERQRVALARALILKPEVLLMDEPVSALDEATREYICSQLKQILKSTGTTVIHVSHSIEETSLVSDRIGLMRFGKLLQSGTLDEVRAQPADDEVRRYFRIS